MTVQLESINLIVIDDCLLDSISLYVLYVDQQCRKFRSVIGRRHLSAHDSPTKDSTQNEHLEIS